MRERLKFKVYGSTEPEMKDQALSQIKKFLGESTELDSLLIEIEFEELDAGTNLEYVGTVYVKIK
jgi:hypothetical protein